MEWFHNFLLKYFLPYKGIVHFLKRIPFPGNKQVKMDEVLGFFIMQLPNEALTTRASAIAFNFFLAIFPALIFLFTLLPYVPINNLQKEILGFFEGSIPTYAYQTISGTLEDLLSTKRSGLLSFGILITLYFASNGFSSLLAAFDSEGSFWHQKLQSLLLLFVTSILVIIAVGVNIATEYVLSMVNDKIFHFPNLITYLLYIIKWLLILGLTYLVVATLYYVGTPKHKRLSFFSPAASLSTVSILLISYGYGYYVENFGSYNRFYGSLGALIVTMLWMYFCALVLMIWYIYNQSHYKFKHNNTIEVLSDIES